jgi:hypothetical protein
MLLYEILDASLDTETRHWIWAQVEEKMAVSLLLPPSSLPSFLYPPLSSYLLPLDLLTQ